MHEKIYKHAIKITSVKYFLNTFGFKDTSGQISDSVL